MGMLGSTDFYNGQALSPTNPGPTLGASGGNQPASGAYLDVSQLQPIGSPVPDGMSSGDTPSMVQRYNSPAGEVRGIIGQDGQLQGYQVGRPDGQYATFEADGTYKNSFAPGKGNFWDDFKGNVLEDENFWKFAAVATAGAAMGGAFGGAAGASGAEMSAAGMEGSAYVGMPTYGAAAEAELLAGAGIGAGGGVTNAAGGAGSVTAGAAGGAGLSGGAAAAGGAASGGMLSNLTGLPQNVLNGIGGIGSGLFDIWNRNNQSNRMNDAVTEANQNTRAAGARASEDMLGAGERAAALSGFTPYNISGGLTGTRVGADGSVEQTMDPRLRGIQDQQLSGAQGFFGSVNAGTPQAQSEAAYQNYLNWAKPAQDQQFAGLQNTLAKQGLIGLNVGTQALPPVQQANNGQQMLYAGGSANSAAQYAGGTPGQPISVNPYYKDFAQGVALADLKNYENSIKFGQDVTAGQIGLGNGMLNGAMGIDKLGQGSLEQSMQFGNSRSQAGARAGGFLTDAARYSGNYLVDVNRQAGDRTFDRANEDASQDALRNRSIWDAIWNNVL